MSDDTDGAGQKVEYDPFAIARRKVERFDQVMRDLPPHPPGEIQAENPQTIQVNGYEVPLDQLGWVMDEYMRLKAADNWDWDPVRMGEDDQSP